MPSCPSLRRRSSGRWKRLTELWDQEDGTELQKRSFEKRRWEGAFRLDGNSAVRKQIKESRKLEGTMCDRMEIVLHGRKSSIKRAVIFYGLSEHLHQRLDQTHIN